MSLLREIRDFKTSNTEVFLGEAFGIDGRKDLYLKGIFLQADIRNQNQRVYPLMEIQRAIEKIRGKISNGETPCGEAQHPAELEINIDRISHEICDLWLEGSNGMGKMKILPTPCGILVRTLIESKIRLGVSSRGSGDVDHNGVVHDFEIVTIDIVTTPSAPNAYPKPIYESLYSMKGFNTVYSIAKDATHSKVAQMELAKEMASFIKNELKH